MRRNDGKPKIFRAGKRKCIRCKVVWKRKRGDRHFNCPRCQARCPRCDVKLTADDLSAKSQSNSYKCRVCVNELCLVSKRKTDPTRERARDWKLVREYGITSVEYDAMLKAQNEVCWICEKGPKEDGRRLSVDHLHSKGERQRNPREKRGRVRGLLCWGCNAAIGKFKDDITKLRRAADYLEQWPAQAVLKEK